MATAEHVLNGTNSIYSWLFDPSRLFEQNSPTRMYELGEAHKRVEGGVVLMLDSQVAERRRGNGRRRRRGNEMGS